GRITAPRAGWTVRGYDMDLSRYLSRPSTGLSLRSGIADLPAQRPERPVEVACGRSRVAVHELRAFLERVAVVVMEDHDGPCRRESRQWARSRSAERSSKARCSEISSGTSS